MKIPPGRVEPAGRYFFHFQLTDQAAPVSVLRLSGLDGGSLFLDLLVVIGLHEREPDDGRENKGQDGEDHAGDAALRSDKGADGLGHGDTALMNELVFAGLGKKYGKTPAQVILRWHTQMGFVVIPGSKNAEHIKDNMDIFDFALTDEEMEQIAKLDKNERYYHRTDEQLVQFANWKPEFEK